MSQDITQLLKKYNSSNQASEKQLVEIVYPKLRRIASRQMRLENKNHTLQATALINEAYLELFRSSIRSWENRNEFFAYASTIMRHILVDHARRKNAQKRGGDLLQVTLHDLPGTDQDEDSLVSLDEALHRLSEIDERKSKIVELRFFGGLTIDEIAQVVDLSLSAVNKELRAARGWLFHRMKDR